MKKIYATLFIASFALTAQAQNAATPNADFEAWTHVSGFTAYDDPNNWTTLNSTTASFGVITCYKATAAGEFHAGAAALKLITKNAVIQTAQGIATTGTINTSNQSITGGIPYTGRPDSIVGWYRCSPVNNDAGFVQFMLLDGTGDTIGYAKFQASLTTTVSSYTRFSVPVTYWNANTPVTSQWIISSSAGNSGQQVNSTMWVDDLDLIFNPASVNEAQLQSGFRVGPSPASNEVLIRNAKKTKATITLYSVTGQRFASQPVNEELNALDVTKLASGIYLYSITDENGKLLLSSKISVQH